MSEKNLLEQNNLDENILYAKNLDYFKLTNASIYKNLCLLENNAALIESKNNKTNIWLSDIPFYPHSFEETFKHHQKNQIKYTVSFLKNIFDIPTKTKTTKPSATDISSIAKNKYKELAIKNKLTLVDNKSIVCGGILIILGLGTGQQIVEMVKSFKPNKVIIFENQLYILQATMKFFSWSKLEEKLKKLGCDLRLFVTNNNNPSIAVHSFMETIPTDEKQYSYIITFYLHNNSSFFKSCLEHLKSSKYIFNVVEGFMEDEITMIDNIINNINNSNKKILIQTKRVSKNCPALIVGSGPSVEDNYQLISELQQSMVLFSCGTALSGLLKHGIIPDFHCELENGEQIVDHFKELKKLYSFKDIQLICSYSVSPEITSFFNKVSFFVRPGPNLALAFDGIASSIYGSEPTVLNTALSISINYGFETFYVFGCDNGSLDNTVHHAKSILFYKNKSINKKHHKLLEETKYNREFPIETKANFGGISYTNTIMQLAASCVSLMLFFSKENKVYNCSDGCYIDGMTPCLPQSIEVQKCSKEDKNKDLKFVDNFSKDISELKKYSNEIVAKLISYNDSLVKSLLNYINQDQPINSPRKLSDFLKDLNQRYFIDKYLEFRDSESKEQVYEYIVLKSWHPSLSDVFLNIYYSINCLNVGNWSKFESDTKQYLNEMIAIMDTKYNTIRSLLS